MFPRILALLFTALAVTQAQEAFKADLGTALPDLRDSNGIRIPAESAWLDLRQTSTTYSTPQNAPRWVESVMLLPVHVAAGEPPRTVFRIRVLRPRGELQLLLFRLFFDDKPEQRPAIVAWDESGTQVLKSAPLGSGIDLPTSDSVTIPMIGVSCIDVEVPGNGETVRGAYLDWMTSRTVAQPMSAEARDVMPQPFSATAPLHPPDSDREAFGTVTASLAPEVIRIGPSVQQGAAFQFPLEAQPLAAMLTFEVSSAYVDSLPNVYLNGANLGPVTVTLPELADPAYRGEMKPLMREMRFQYTGWLRAQKVLPASSLHAGANDLLVIAGAGTPASAIRATQIQLKYVWEKFDYQLIPGR